MINEDSNKQWHQYFYYVLQELLTPVGLIVQPESPLGAYPPKVDVIIIRRETKYWTPEQLERLPDGIRYSKAPYILLEFKYTESFNENAIYQIAFYERSYRKKQNLMKEQVQSFLIISKTPRPARLVKFDYELTKHKGVYQSTNILATPFQMLVLNELGNQPYNVYFKLFASKLIAKQKAARVIEKETKIQSFSKSLMWFLNALLALWFPVGGNKMKLDATLTPEEMVEAGRRLTYLVLPHLSLEERLVGIPLEERLAGVPLKERLAGVPLKERLAGVPLKERLADIPLNKIPETELEEIPFIHHIEEKGIEKGIEKGEHKATIESLSKIITLRFKGEGEQFEKQLITLPLNVLKHLTEVALTVETLADFEQTLTEIQVQEQAKKLEDNTDTIEKNLNLL